MQLKSITVTDVARSKVYISFSAEKMSSGMLFPSTAHCGSSGTQPENDSTGKEELQPLSFSE